MAVSSFMAPKREKPSASSITRKEMSPLRQADASVASDEKMEWSHFIGVGGKGLSAISILTPGCSNSNQPFGEVGRFSQEARALLGWLSTRGSSVKKLDLKARRCKKNTMSMHSVSLLLEAILLKARSLEQLGLRKDLTEPRRFLNVDRPLLLCHRHHRI
ncbi:uncharacterized protein LOC116250286 isoform X4 [Nymphaea colorata]|uniref:uncharacterized protein LOC116250286 isoform X4 n=1 Tax=Nymphaea colorata TaxID=210225 RepID=UPI00129E273F|nr:uncharacterized protein LOC116250286 isoform X4 [Nymphaea colorata]